MAANDTNSKNSRIQGSNALDKNCETVKMPQMSFNDWKLKNEKQQTSELKKSNLNSRNDENKWKDYKNIPRNGNSGWIKQRNVQRCINTNSNWSAPPKNLSRHMNSNKNWAESENSFKCYENQNKDWIEPGYQPLLEQQKFKPPHNFQNRKKSFLDKKSRNNGSFGKSLSETPIKKHVNKITGTKSKITPSEQKAAVVVTISKPPVLNKIPKEQTPKTEQNNTVQKKPKSLPPYIPKPVMPPPMIATTPESKEEKQRLWRAYRQAMKPFKNREFANAKRTIQRLKKKDMSEFNEIELTRWQNAHGIVAEHKSKISQKANVRWIIAENQEVDPTLSKQPQIYVQNPSYNRNQRTTDTNTSSQDNTTVPNCPTTNTKTNWNNTTTPTTPHNIYFKNSLPEQNFPANNTTTNWSNISESNSQSVYFPSTPPNTVGMQSNTSNWSSYFANTSLEQNDATKDVTSKHGDAWSSLSATNTQNSYFQNNAVTYSFPQTDTTTSWSVPTDTNSQNDYFPNTLTAQNPATNNLATGFAQNKLDEQNSNTNYTAPPTSDWNWKTNM